MNITATVLLAFGMSMDAFAASIGKGATLHKPKFSEALRTGLIFGAVETLTPLIGWGMGMLASRFVLEWNHWIAFVLLIFLGGRMIIEGFRGADDEDEEPRRRHRFLATGKPPRLPPAWMPWLWVLVLLSCRSTLSRPHWPLVVQP
ncbi:inner membrane protein [Escherichia coli]|uniref:Inner membrane protein n=1 Tax=Escherichia coli TaxID=562 RepID=A0A376TE51_ECOLX|nr:inner membrane protein [Escherichia coli]